MHGLLLFLHVASFSVWLGASLTFMIWGPSARGASLQAWAHTWITLAKLQRAIVAPASLVATLTGIVLTLSLVQGHFDMGSAVWLMVMQAFGIVAALLTLAIATPLANRMGMLAERSLEKGVQEPSAESIRKKLALVGSLAGAFVLVAVYFGTLKPTI